jgi:hypothetical protein
MITTNLFTSVGSAFFLDGWLVLPSRDALNLILMLLSGSLVRYAAKDIS